MTTRPTKVCILTERMRLGFGVDLVVDEQARRLLKLGFEVIVVVIHADLIQPRRDYKLVVINRIMAVRDIESEMGMRRILSRFNLDADLWILHTPPFYEWAKYLNAPVILVEYGAPPGQFFRSDVGRSIDSMAAKRLTEIYGNLLPCDAIVCISQSLHQWLPKTVQPFSKVIHLGWDHYLPVSAEEASKLRSNLAIGSDECMILWVGRMQLEGDEQPYKGFQELLALIPLIKRQVLSAKFVLAGRVSDKDKYRIENYGVTVLANQSAEELARAYAAADVLINLSRWEGFNLALLEAQAQGTPVVAYDLGPHPEIVRHNESGFLAKTPQDFFQSVVKISTDRTLREKLGQQARAFARDFTWDRNVKELVKVMVACGSSDVPKADIAALRKNAVSAIPPTRIAVHVREILQLDDKKFLNLACASLLTVAPEQATKASWLRQLRKGVGKRTVLLQITDFANARGCGRNVPGLRATLLAARAVHPFRRTSPRKVQGRRSGLVTMGTDPAAGKAVKSVEELLALHDEEFVRSAYLTVLGRPADPEGLAAYLEHVRSGADRAELLVALATSSEGEQLEPRRIQGLIEIIEASRRRRTSFLSRVSHATRIRVTWTRALEFVGNLLALGSPPPFSEWFSLDDQDFIRHAYRTLLGREASAEAIGDRVEQLKKGYSRSAILATIRFSDEGKIRPLRDPILRRILFAEQLRQSPPIAWVLGRSRKVPVEPEDIHRQIRRIDSQQRVLAADFRNFSATLDKVAHDFRTLESIAERLGTLEVKIGTRRGGAQGGQGSSFTAPTSVGVFLGAPITADLTALRLGSSHVALIAPGALLDGGALTRLAQAAQASNSDILFGNEFERLDKPPFQRLRMHGPFSHDAFLRNPDLGGVIAVHNSLVEEMQWPQTVALTGQVALQLVALAHTVTHVPATLSERSRADITTNRPTIAHMRTYLDRIGRRALISEDGNAGFDVRFPTSSEWKAAIIVMQGGDDDVNSLVEIRANTAPHRYHLLKVRASESPYEGNEGFSDAGDHATVLALHKDMSYGSMVNEAVRRAPRDCNLVVIMDGGVSPTTPDWLERLAETALTAGVGAVAPKTLYPNGQIRHAGMAVGLGQPGYVSRFVCSEDINGGGRDVDLNRLNGMRDVSIVSRHCMMMRRSVFHEQGRFLETLGQEASDIEFCCRLQRVGMSVILDGRVVMSQPDPAPRWARRLPAEDLSALWTKHSDFLEGPDRFWNPTQGIASARVNDVTANHTTRLPPTENR